MFVEPPVNNSRIRCTYRTLWFIFNKITIFTKSNIFIIKCILKWVKILIM
jgi:hypothetical protein